MDEQLAKKIDNTEANAGDWPQVRTAKKHGSGVFAKGVPDGNGWGMLLIGQEGELSPITLSDGAVLGSASTDARLEGGGIGAEHARVSIRADGCYLEDLGTDGGTYVNGVRAKRISLSHGDVVRFGERLAIFIERDLSAYEGPVVETDGLLAGPRQRATWVAPIVELAKSGACVCIDGSAGTGKRTMARMAAKAREALGEIITIEGKSAETAAFPKTSRPQTWVVFDAEKLPRAQQLDLVHALDNTPGATIIATVGQRFERAASDGKLAPWFASLFSGKRVTITPLDGRCEDIPALVIAFAKTQGIDRERLSTELLEALTRSGWPGGVPQLQAALMQAATATAADEMILPRAIMSSLVRPSRTAISLPPSNDPALARARLEDALAKSNGSVASAARSLGMSRQAIYREAERLGIDIPLVRRGPAA